MSDGARIGLGRRLKAFVLDILFATIGGVVIGTLVNLYGLGRFPGGRALLGEGLRELSGGVVGNLIEALLAVLLGITVFGTLYGLIEALTGASPGKLALGIRIRRADGSRAGIGRLFARYAVKHVSLWFGIGYTVSGIQLVNLIGRGLSLVVGLGFLLVLGAARQALHDHVAGTAVYLWDYEPPPVAEQPDKSL